MHVFEDWNLKVKKTFNATSNEVVLTVSEVGSLLGLSKDQMKVHRYLLLKSEIDEILKNS